MGGKYKSEEQEDHGKYSSFLFEFYFEICVIKGLEDIRT